MKLNLRNIFYLVLGGENSPLAESILDRIVHDAYRVKLEAIDPEQDISMREIYGLKDEY